MACVRWPTRDQFIPSSLKRVSFDDIAVNLDTSKHYIQVCLSCYTIPVTLKLLHQFDGYIKYMSEK